MSPSASPVDVPDASLPSYQSCGSGCAYAAAGHPAWSGDWVWCEHPDRNTGRLVRIDSECHRFQSKRPASSP